MYAKLNNKIVVITLIISCLFIFVSCGTGLKVSKANYKKMDINFSGAFINSSFKTKTGTAIPGLSTDISNESKTTIASLLRLSDVKKSQTDPIIFKLNTDKNLVVTYVDSLQIQKTKVFKGKLRKRGYYEYFHYKERVEIPPLFPIIYGEVHISRLRFGFSNNNLVIDDYYISNGNIFIFAAGNSHREQYYFKPIDQ